MVLNNGYHDLPERTERTFVDAETDFMGTETDFSGYQNGLSWIPNWKFWVPKWTLVDTETDSLGTKL